MVIDSYKELFEYLVWYNRRRDNPAARTSLVNVVRAEKRKIVLGHMARRYAEIVKAA